MKRKILSMLLAVAMLSACLAGCGKKTTEESKTPASTAGQEAEASTQASTEEKVQLEEKTIQMWLLGPGKQKDSDEVWKAWNEKLREYVPNTTVELTVMPASEYKTKFQQMLAAGEKVDLAWVGYATKLATDITDGNLMDLTDLVKEYGKDIIEILGQDVLNVNKSKDGNLYYLISWQGLVGSKRYCYVPADIAKLAGDGWLEETKKAVDAWWNNPYSVDAHQKVFDQFAIYLEAAKNAGKLYGGVDMSGFMGYEYPYHSGNTSQFTVMRYDDTFTVVDRYATDSFKTYSKNIADYYVKGYVRSDVASLTYGASGTIGFVKDGKLDNNTTILTFTENDEQNQESISGMDLECIPIEREYTISKGSETAMAIPYSADEAERAMMVLNAIYAEPELYQLLIYGIEGKHYTKKADGTIVTPYGINPTVESDYGLTKWAIGTCMNALATQDEDPEYYVKKAQAEATAQVHPLANLSVSTTAIKEYTTGLSAINGEYGGQFMKGYVGKDYEKVYEKFMKERAAANVDKCIEHYQQQYNEYLKNYNITGWGW